LLRPSRYIDPCLDTTCNQRVFCKISEEQRAFKPWQIDCSSLVPMSNERTVEVPNLGVPETQESGEKGMGRPPRNQYCVFRSGRDSYCLSVSEVEEVVEWSNLTRVPLAPPFLLGILNLRGVIIPVLDLAYLEDRRPEVSPTHLVVAVWRSENGSALMRVGLAADEMFGSYSTSEPLLVDQAPSEVVHCRGMLRHNNRLALALDLHRLPEAFPIPIT
jgi:purine-binding chemotaxis protein CheW